MTDAEFDAAKARLKEIDPDNPFIKQVGAPPSGHLTEVEHTIPMGSLENASNAQEFETWFQRWNQPVIAMLKLDGSSIALTYVDGRLVRAVTRGNGLVGEDVTQNIRNFRNIPLKVADNFTGSVRGEAMLKIKDFRDHFPGAANPRNAANGTVRRSDGTGSEYLVFYAFDVKNGEQFKCHRNKLMFLQNIGFDTVPFVVHKTANGVLDYHQHTQSERDKLPIEIDGLVVRVDDEQAFIEAGERNMRPRAAIAFKFKAMEAITTLDGIELTMGHTGAIIPTAKLSPISIGGVTVVSALLNNFDYIRDLGVAIGDKVVVSRRGDVIPHIEGVHEEAPDRKPIEEPTECIKCGSELIKDGVHLVCGSMDCAGHAEMLFKNYIKKRDIKFIGDSLRQILFYDHGITEPHQLYEIEEDWLSRVSVGNGVVGSNAKRIIAEINDSRSAKLSEFMGSLGVKFLGRRMAEIMINDGLVKSVDDFMNLDVDWLARQEGFSTTKATGIVEGIQAIRETIQKLLEHVEVRPIEEPEPEVEPSTDGLAGQSFCFTGAIKATDDSGKRMTRQMMWDLVKVHGGVVHEKVKPDTNYLVMADPNSNSSKARKAREAGVGLLSEDDFFEMIK